MSLNSGLSDASSQLEGTLCFSLCFTLEGTCQLIFYILSHLHLTITREVYDVPLPSSSSYFTEDDAEM